MTKTIISIVVATLISTLLLSFLGYAEPFEFNKEDDETTAKVTTVTVAADQAEDLPGAVDSTETVACPEETDGPDTDVSDSPANTTEAPQIDYGWGEQPGPS